MVSIKLAGIKKQYEGAEDYSVKDFNLTIEDKEFIVFVGPSGCGKSTTLRMIAGLEEITDGELLIDGKVMNNVAPKDRNIAMVFQNYALYPHMTVYENLSFGLELRKYKKDDIDSRVKIAADILGLNDFLERKPAALSGGQRQRVALGRVIVREANIFLMDEPLSNLDAKLRVQMRSEIAKLHNRLGTTTIYVTHDQSEAMTLATRIVIMNDGEIQQIGIPEDVYNYPTNTFVASFIGSPAMNLIRVTYKDGFVTGDNGLKLPVALPYKKKLDEQGYQGKEITLGIRPEDIHDEQIIIDSSKESTVNLLVEVVELMGSEIVLYTSLGEDELIAKISTRQKPKVGDTVELAFNLNKVHYFDIDTGNRIK